MTTAIITISNVIPATKTAFGIREDNGESVFVPASVSRAMGLAKGDTVQAKLAPNRQPSATAREPIKWAAIAATSDFGADIDVEAVRAALSGFDYPVRAEEAGVDITALEVAHRLGEVVKVVASQSPTAPKVVMWTDSMDKA